MTEKLSDGLFISVDASRQAVTITIVRQDAPRSAQPKASVSLADLRAMPPTEAETRVGAAVLSLLANCFGTTFAGRSYSTIADASLAQADAVIAKRAEAGDSEAQNSLGLKLLEDSLRLRDPSLLDIAEAWLTRAANNGYGPAIAFLELSWPAVKTNYRERIERGE